MEQNAIKYLHAKIERCAKFSSQWIKIYFARAMYIDTIILA